ncbi:hypothetical protein HMH01_12320 [Halovulum dunhuangense]|uniref:DUF115 domain-containing protein n=1 Tax=Halovulum dunhuangense TaxID=1505036 RepID=A0A849L502_9RHOB|nr:hypothetical protein [Halovulum dunhuangense]NNU81221.1 hypothetical protein [Halovulum dunhuangense]
MTDIVLILGSGPDVTRCRDWARAPFDKILAINNAWAVRDDWDILIHPEDFPPERRPQDPAPHQRIVGADEYVPAQNALGGFVYAGGTMAFTAGYWALAALRPKVIAYLGCDMVYRSGPRTHFYGNGTADPLRPDVTLQSLEAKSARLMIHAAEQGCAMVNLSTAPKSRLVLPRSSADALGSGVPDLPAIDPAAVRRARAHEAALGYLVPSGRYWEVEDSLDAAALAEIDRAWLSAVAGDAARPGVESRTTAVA